VLSSAIGSAEAQPVLTRVDGRHLGSVLLFCTDGLTKHVTDAEIEAHLATMESSEQVCRALLALALDRGGRDNVTIVVARARRRSPVGAGDRPAR
jgi:protein phosphatase